MTVRTGVFSHRFGTLSKTYDVGPARRLTRRGVPVGPFREITKVYKGNATISEAVSDTRFEGTVTIDGGSLTNFEVVGTAAGSNATLLTILDAGGTATDGRVVPQNPSVKVSYGVRLAGGRVERLDVGFVGDAYAAVRNTTHMLDCVGRDLVMSMSSTAVGGFSHDDVYQAHGGFGHTVIGCDLLAWYTNLFGVAGRRPVYDGPGKLVDGNPRYDGRTGRYHAMSAMMLAAPGVHSLDIAFNYIEGGACGINGGAMGSGAGQPNLGKIRSNLFTPDQGNHDHLAMIFADTNPVQKTDNWYTDGTPALSKQS